MLGTNVEMVADEVFCGMPNNGSQRRRPAATSCYVQSMFRNQKQCVGEIEWLLWTQQQGKSETTVEGLPKNPSAIRAASA
jgi:hypothetical protein